MKRSFPCLLGWLTAAGLLHAAESSMVINEIYHSPAVKQEPVEFIELFNRGSEPQNLTGWKLSGAVDFAFPAGLNVPAGGYAVIAGNPAAVATKYGVTGVIGPWIGRLAGTGERVQLRDAAGVVVNEVDYQLGFPWPTVGDAPGYSIELLNPGSDNSLGGNWRASTTGGSATSVVPLVAKQAVWHYRKGTAEASTPTTAWRDLGFDDATWDTGPSPIGYDPAVAFGTTLADMRGGYTQFFLRRHFTLDHTTGITSLRVNALYDDGFKLWLNGVLIDHRAMDTAEVPFNGTATGAARENNEYESIDLPIPAGALHEGDNVIAVQVANVNLGSSSDCFFDLELAGLVGPIGQGPTPGRANVVLTPNAPPAIRQVEHLPIQPLTGEIVTISARITDPDGVDAVTLEYQVVEPGQYIELTDPAYRTGWTALPMLAKQGVPDVYEASLPAEVARHRRLIRYRLKAEDKLGAQVQVPYADDPQPNFAFYCYDGVPAWQGAVRPGSGGALGQPFTVETSEMNRLGVFHLLARSNAVAVASGWAPGQPNNQYGGDSYLWQGALVYEGKVYDHIRFRMRGGVWRYSMGKNAWKFDLNRGHDLEMRDDYGRRYRATWDKLSFRPDIQQGDYNHRGEQGLFESVGYRLFQLAGVEANRTTHVQFRIVDEVEEAKSADQFGGDFWGLYLAVEEQDGRFLEEHGLPDGNIYDMEGGSGTLNHTSINGPLDKSDLNAFLNAYDGNNYLNLNESWWRTNLDLPSYYSHQAILQGIHHYDIADGKNYFYYHNDETRKWTVQPWDLDLTWADNMYRAGQQGGDEPFKLRVLSNFGTNPRYPNLTREFRNRVRELRDLLFNSDQAGAVIDEQALLIRGTNAFSITDADRSQWDYNPVMTNTAITLSSKAGWGRFYQFPNEQPGTPKSFAGAVQLMKRYVDYRSTNATFSLDKISAEAGIPATPVVSYRGPAGFPLNQLVFATTPFSGGGTFGSMRWRVAEVTRTNHPSYRSDRPWKFEITPSWESEELTQATETVTFPAEALEVGHLYRARVRYLDSEGRASHWSAPIEFTAGEPESGPALVAHLRLTELMYNPPPEGFEFLELHNESATETLTLDGANFTAGINFSFPAHSTLPPGNYALVIKTTNFPAFRAYYHVPESVQLYGPYDGSLDNGGETVTLKTAAGGAVIFSLRYSDTAPWPLDTDGTGRSLVPLEGSVAPVEDPLHWRASTDLGGSAGRADPLPSSLVISEARTEGDVFHAKLVTTPSTLWVLQATTDLQLWKDVATNTGPTEVTFPVGPAGLQAWRGVIR